MLRRAASKLELMVNSKIKCLALVVLLALSASACACAQDTQTMPPHGMGPGMRAMVNPLYDRVRPRGVGVFVEGGNGLTDRSGFHFVSAGGHAGKVLTPNYGSGATRVNFEYGVEVIPLWQSFTPKFQRVSCTQPAGSAAIQCSQPYTVGGRFTGVSVVPIILRANFAGNRKLSPWIQGAGGVLYTTHKYPSYGDTTVNLQTNGPNGDASVWNFTPQFGVGAHYFTRADRSFDFSANAVHISSASLGDRNPGVNASIQFALGYTWWK